MRTERPCTAGPLDTDPERKRAIKIAQFAMPRVGFGPRPRPGEAPLPAHSPSCVVRPVATSNSKIAGTSMAAVAKP
jgi:hypothetical protein